MRALPTSAKTTWPGVASLRTEKDPPPNPHCIASLTDISPRRWFSDYLTPESLDLNGPAASLSEHGDLAGR